MTRTLLITTVLLLVTGVAFGQEFDMKRAPAVRNRILLREGRHEIFPGISSLVSGRYYHGLVFRLGYRYHITDWFAVGAEGGYALNWQTGLARNIQRERSTETMAFSIPATHLGAVAGAHLSFTPMSGKLLLFNYALHYDFHLNIGASGLQVLWNKAAADDVSVGDEFVVAPMMGGGFRLFLNRSMALTLDLTDHFANMYVAAPAGDNNTLSTPSRVWTHNMMATLSLNILLPYRSAMR